MYDYHLITNVDTIPQQRKYHVYVSTSKHGSKPNILVYECENIREGINYIHDKILGLYNDEEFAKQVGVEVALKYRRYDDLVIEQCNRYGEPYDPFVVLDQHSRFILQLGNITSM